MKKKEKVSTNSEGKKLSKKEEVIQFFKFLGFSISAGVIQFGLNALMYEVLHIDWWISYLVSIIASVIWNFTFNRKFTFKSATNVPLAMTLVLVYYAAFIPISVFGGDALENIGWNGLLVTAIMMVLNFITEFVWQKFVVFRDYSKKSQEDREVEAEITKVRENEKSVKVNEKELKIENKAKKKEELEAGEINYEALDEFNLDDIHDEKKVRNVDKPPKLGEINYDSIREEMKLLEEIRKKRGY